MLQSVEKASDGKYKWVANFSDGTRTRFGATGYPDYTLTGDKEARERYRKRHAKDLKTGDPKRAGYLSMYLLWGDSQNMNTNIREYNRRFFSG
jgi:hypothetical protein